jgi:hypothetical protein
MKVIVVKFCLKQLCLGSTWSVHVQYTAKISAFPLVHGSLASVLRTITDTSAVDIKIRKHKTTILPAVLYGRETWSLTLREEHRLRMFQNRVLRRIFGPKRDEVAGDGGICITRGFITCTAHQT